MASLVKQGTYYYAQFYDSSRTPKRKKIPLKTKEKRLARRLLGRMEDAFAIGDYDPWTDGREHPLFGWEPEPKRDLSTLPKAMDAFLKDGSHLRSGILRLGPIIPCVLGSTERPSELYMGYCMYVSRNLTIGNHCNAQTRT